MEPSNQLHSFLNRNSSVSFVRLQWIDLSGILRCRILTVEYCKKLTSTGGFVSLAPLSMICMVDGTALDTWEASGTDKLYPDWDSLRLSNFGSDLAYKFKYATVMCILRESSPLHPDMGLSRCPRSILYKVLEKATRHHDLTFLVGYEVEFIVARRHSSGDVEQVDFHAGRNSFAGCRTSSFRYVEESVRELQAIGIEVQQFHTEGYRGQYEISTGPLPPMEAVDAYLSTSDAIKNVCARHHMYASMHPKIFDSCPATGTHAHISLSPPDNEDSFIAGILNRMPALCAFSMANIDSYRRLDEAGRWVSWGTQSRDVPIRKVSTGHWEIRSADATANPYLFLAAYIGAGLLGIENSETLRCKDSQRWSSTYTREEREALNIVTPMPDSLLATVGNLEVQSHGLAEVIGKDIISQYTYLKKREIELVQNWGFEERKRFYSEYF